MRFDCDLEGFEGAFVEFSPAGWTRRDMRIVTALSETEDWYTVIRGKIVAVSLPTVNGDPIVEAVSLTPDAMDRLDIVLVNWLTAVIVKALREVSDLGNVAWRRLFPLVAASNSADESLTK